MGQNQFLYSPRVIVSDVSVVEKLGATGVENQIF